MNINSAILIVMIALLFFGIVIGMLIGRNWRANSEYKRGASDESKRWENSLIVMVGKKGFVAVQTDPLKRVVMGLINLENKDLRISSISVSSLHPISSEELTAVLAAFLEEISAPSPSTESGRDSAGSP